MNPKSNSFSIRESFLILNNLCEFTALEQKFLLFLYVFFTDICIQNKSELRYGLTNSINKY